MAKVSWLPQLLLKELDTQGTIQARDCAERSALTGDRNQRLYEVIPTAIGLLCGQNSNLLYETEIQDVMYL